MDHVESPWIQSVYCKSRHFWWCNTFGILQNRWFGGGKFSVIPAFQVRVLALLRSTEKFRCIFSVKIVGTEVTENKTPLKISAFTVHHFGYHDLVLFPWVLRIPDMHWSMARYDLGDFSQSVDVLRGVYSMIHPAQFTRVAPRVNIGRSLREGGGGGPSSP